MNSLCLSLSSTSVFNWYRYLGTFCVDVDKFLFFIFSTPTANSAYFGAHIGLEKSVLLYFAVLSRARGGHLNSRETVPLMSLGRFR